MSDAPPPPEQPKRQPERKRRASGVQAPDKKLGRTASGHKEVTTDMKEQKLEPTASGDKKDKKAVGVEHVPVASGGGATKTRKKRKGHRKQATALPEDSGDEAEVSHELAREPRPKKRCLRKRKRGRATAKKMKRSKGAGSSVEARPATEAEPMQLDIRPALRCAC